jgi:hypothetical protein
MCESSFPGFQFHHTFHFAQKKRERMELKEETILILWKKEIFLASRSHAFHIKNIINRREKIVEISSFDNHNFYAVLKSENSFWFFGNFSYKPLQKTIRSSSLFVRLVLPLLRYHNLSLFHSQSPRQEGFTS